MRAGHQVSLLLRPASRLKRLQGEDGSFYIGRCSTDADIQSFVRKCQPQVVVHTACAYGREGETRLQLFDANFRFGVVVAEALQSVVHEATFINTGSVLGPDVNFYALSKHQFTQWGHNVAATSKGRFRFINVALQHMYGPGDHPSKFTTHVLRACKRNEPSLNLTSGKQERDFIYIDDVVRAYDTLLTHQYQFGPSDDVDVGSGVAPSIREFVETAHRLTESRTELNFGVLNHRANEPMRCRANTERLTQLGWWPAFDLQSGLQKTIEMEDAD